MIPKVVKEKTYGYAHLPTSQLVHVKVEREGGVWVCQREGGLRRATNVAVEGAFMLFLPTLATIN